MTQTETREDHGLANALAWFQSIKEMVDNLRAFEAKDQRKQRRDAREGEDARTAINQSVLSVEVRSGWYSPAGGNADSAPAEYRILLTTGGPAGQLVGDLSEHGEPESARLQAQDWFKPWEDVHMDQLCSLADKAVPAGSVNGDAIEAVKSYLLTFARQFYFGEG